MFEQIEAIVAHTHDPATRRNQRPQRAVQPVRRHSRLKGRDECIFWRRTDRKQVRHILLAARRYELQTRQPGARSGALGFVALEVLELFTNLVDFKTGRLDPSLDYLMSKLKRSRDAIHRALRALRTHGFLDWLRRYVPTGIEGRGPQVQQTSNAYRLSLPLKALQWLGRFGKPSPVPEDVTHAQQQRKAEIEAHITTLSNHDLPLFMIEDNGIAQALARLGKCMDERKERESAKRSES